ncbi:MAG: hypothetical protein H6742_18070 [Alphaproteobacteria bacterium]|nr:hypothetical protein [Alphaproteobacteria bacterium]
MTDAFLLSAWSAGVFIAPLLTALPAYRPTTWWLWPALRVFWQLGGGMLAGVAAARIVGVPQQGQLVAAALLGAVGALLCIAPLVAMTRGPTRVEGDLRGLRHTTATTRSPVSRPQRVDRVEVELHTTNGPVRLTFRGLQGSYVERRLADLRPGAHVVLWLLAPLRALVHVEPA